MTNVSTLPPLQSGRYFLHQQPNLASIPSSISHSALSTAMSIPPPLWNSNQPKHLAYEFDNGIPPALFKNNSLTSVRYKILPLLNLLVLDSFTHSKHQPLQRANQPPNLMNFDTIMRCIHQPMEEWDKMFCIRLQAFPEACIPRHEPS